MYINEQCQNLTLLDTASYQYIGRDGICQKEAEPILREHLMDIYINDQLTMKLICIPQYLAELVLGRMLTEGMIGSSDDVEQIYIGEHGSLAKVLLRRTAVRDLENYMEAAPVTPIPWRASHVFALADRFAAGMPVHRQTFATHSCFLARQDELLFQCEDIGRHNALDKAIGYALRHGINLGECTVYSSGRIPTDMAMKAIRAGIPILSSKASPSAEAVRLAEKYGLTLVCAARRDRMKLFAGAPPEDVQA